MREGRKGLGLVLSMPSISGMVSVISILQSSKRICSGQGGGESSPYLSSKCWEQEGGKHGRFILTSGINKGYPSTG